MNAKRILSLLLVSLLSLSLLAGCNGDPAPSTSTDPSPAATPSQSTEPTADPVTLNWAIWDLEQTAYYKPLVEAYRANNPHVTIEFTDLGSTDYMNLLQTQLAGGADFDVVTVKDIPGYANLVAQDLLEPLSPLGVDTSVYGGTVEQVTVDGEYYQLPFRSDFWVVYYNKDVFDAQGVAYPTNNMTLDDYDALMRQVVNGEGNDKIYGAHYHTWRSTVQLFGILDGQHTVVDGDYMWLKPYYEQILAQQDDGIVMSYATAQSTSSHYRDLFYNRKIAMTNNGTWFIGTMIDAVKNGDTDVANWGIAKYPVPNGVAPGTTIGTITGLAINKSSDKKEAAEDFLKFVCGPEGAEVIAQTGTFPAISNDEITSIIASRDGFPQDGTSAEALETVQIYLEMPLHPKSADIETVLNEEHTEIMTGAKSVDDALAAMEARIAPILAN